MDKIREFLKGKKTYLVAAAAIVTAVGGWAGGELTGTQLIAAIFAAVAAATMRAGVSNK